MDSIPSIYELLSTTTGPCTMSHGGGLNPQHICSESTPCQQLNSPLPPVSCKAASTAVKQRLLPRSSVYCREAASTAVKQRLLPRGSVYCREAASTAARQRLLPRSSVYCREAASTAAKQRLLPRGSVYCREAASTAASRRRPKLPAAL
ncbi:hypothetical protein NHX12_024859 [Muraenolepis orangiensis]|uniref:Uncharacterized protein n=1 Tax=Muraenolepis orangiensis TaxID=630683 RepID=A0A9Q0EK93_9TELE|nr:hypothetical protein NHX12_024859 [Muraenolepis orangiensis]